MDKKGSKLHSIIEKLSEQCKNGEDEIPPSQQEVTEEISNELTDQGIVVVHVNIQPPFPPTVKPPVSRTAKAPVSRTAKAPVPKTAKATVPRTTKTAVPRTTKAAVPRTNKAAVPRTNKAAVSRSRLGRFKKSKAVTIDKCIQTAPPPSASYIPGTTAEPKTQACPPVDDDLCINVNSLMFISPQVRDIDIEHNYSRQSQSENGACRICFRVLNTKKDFLKHIKTFHPECIKKPPAKYVYSDSEEESEEWESEDDEDEDIAWDSDYDPAFDPDKNDCIDSVVTKRQSARLKGRGSIDFNEKENPSGKDEEAGDVEDKEKSVVIKLKELPTTKNVICEICKKTFYFKIELTNHTSKEHSDQEDNITETVPNIYECEHCSRKFSSKEKLLAHIKKVIKKIEKLKISKDYESDDSSDNGGQLDDEQALKLEMKLAAKNKKHACEHCGKKYLFKSSLTKHIADHTNPMSLVCEECGKQFKNREYLRRHKKTHTGEKNYQCDTCKKAFAHRGSLRTHLMIVHTGERPFPCKQCDAAFVTRSLLRAHENRHLGITPFKCSICPKAFYKASHLRTHMISHSDEKPFACKVCGKAFKRRDHLHYHLFIHSDDKPFKCDTCNRKFNQHICLRKHLPCRELERREKKKARDLARDLQEIKPKKPRKAEKRTAKENKVTPVSKKAKPSNNIKNKKVIAKRHGKQESKNTGKRPTKPAKTPLNSTALEKETPQSSTTLEKEIPQSSTSQGMEQITQNDVTKEPQGRRLRRSTRATVNKELCNTSGNKANKVKRSSAQRIAHKTNLSNGTAPLLKTTQALSTQQGATQPISSRQSMRLQSLSTQPLPTRPAPMQQLPSQSHATQQLSSQSHVTQQLSSQSLVMQALPTHPLPMAMAQHPKDNMSCNFDKLDFVGEFPATVSSFNLPTQRLPETSCYASTIPQTFVPFDCSNPETIGVAFDSSGLELYHGVGNHDNTRGYSHNSTNDLSSALLAAMDPDHLSNLVHPAPFFSHT